MLHPSSWDAYSLGCADSVLLRRMGTVPVSYFVKDGLLFYLVVLLPHVGILFFVTVFFNFHRQKARMLLMFKQLDLIKIKINS